MVLNHLIKPAYINSSQREINNLSVFTLGLVMKDEMILNQYSTTCM